MQQDSEQLLQRIKRTRKERVFPAVYTTVSPLNVSKWRVPREKIVTESMESHEVVGEPIPFAAVPWENFTDSGIGESWGAPWETTWMTFRADLPSGTIKLTPGDTLEALIDLGWEDHSAGFQCEALVRDPQGQTIKALNPRNSWVPLTPNSDGSAQVDFNIEAAANPLLLGVPPFQITADGDKLTATLDSIYTLSRADVVIRHDEVYRLDLELALLTELLSAAKVLDAFGWRQLYTLSAATDVLDLQDIRGSAAKARKILAPLWQEPALATASRVFAVGHAHIDSAWLWPLRETRRKVNRTLANVIRLLEDGKKLVFALPAAQHLAWLQEDDPELFERLCRQVAVGNIAPVGGMWVETDANLPGGEAMCRQILEGQAFFERAFGRKCQEIWLPDSFGYSAALPQIADAAGIHHFLTQKISWNETNTFPHHTLNWEGLDGTRIFTHFPPSDTYGSEISGADIHRGVSNFKEIGKTDVQLLLYGYGDGGGGPTREMVDRLSLLENFAGSPKVTTATPEEFWREAEADYACPPVWVGELYLERHRGTFTSQILIKQGNRRCEALLREAELWCTTAATRGLLDYPFVELAEAWRILLLCQFHDILPGSSIHWVNRETVDLHRQIQARCEKQIALALQALSTESGENVGEVEGRILVNATSFAAKGVPAFGAAFISECNSGNEELLESAPMLTVSCDEVPDSAFVSDSGNQSISSGSISNGILQLSFNQSGQCEGFFDATGKNYVPVGQAAGVFRLYHDFPVMWDAWDIDPFYKDTFQEVQMKLECLESNGLSGYAQASATVGNSRLGITWHLAPEAEYAEVTVEADWHEAEKLLKLGFPIDIHTTEAAYETQFGFLKRPTHENTSWDRAAFEVSAQKWLRLNDSSRSFTVVNKSTYGWSMERYARSDGAGTFTEVQATLIKSAKYPDPNQDQGSFSWTFRLYPDISVEESVAAGQLLNIGLREVRGHSFAPLFQVTGATVESVVMVPEGNGDWAIRLYEATGGTRQVNLQFAGAKQVRMADLYYQELGGETMVPDESGRVSFELRAFQLCTLRVTPETTGESLITTSGGRGN